LSYRPTSYKCKARFFCSNFAPKPPKLATVSLSEPKLTPRKINPTLQVRAVNGQLLCQLSYRPKRRLLKVYMGAENLSMRPGTRQLQDSGLFPAQNG